MPRMNGGCHCGNIAVEMTLVDMPDSYRPRACDCDFCRKHGASYVSDTRGSLMIRIRDERESNRYRQGSGSAECLLCRNCGVLVAILYRGDEQLYGAVNAAALATPTGFGPEQIVSPRILSESEKVTRWRDIWFADVQVTHGAHVA